MALIDFGPFCLDTANSRLLRDGAAIKLRPKAFRVLKVLIQNQERNVTHDQMIREAWNGELVSKHTVVVTILEVKKALQDCGSWIRYRPKLGYCLEVPRAEDLLRRAWHLWCYRTPEGLESALGYFQEAVGKNRLDPRPLEGMSLTFLTLGLCGIRPQSEMYRAFRQAYKRAQKLSRPAVLPYHSSSRG
jgi:DNA-binding winged helix-turn-helix (wHTH) protein